MKLQPELIISISNTLTRRFGPDIAHDVVIALLRRRNPIRKPAQWAAAYAYGLSKREATRLSRVRVFSDMSETSQSILAETLGY